MGGSRVRLYLSTFSRYLRKILDFSFEDKPLYGDKKLVKSKKVGWEVLVELTWNDPNVITTGFCRRHNVVMLSAKITDTAACILIQLSLSGLHHQCWSTNILPSV